MAGKIKRHYKKFLGAILLGFIVLNLIFYNQAYTFTHVTDEAARPRIKPEELSFFQKVNYGLFGVKTPKTRNPDHLNSFYETVYLQNDKKIACWWKAAENPKAHVALFHGYKACKGTKHLQAAYLNQQDYNVFLTDFRASGDSEGNMVSVGYFEAVDVYASYQHLKAKNDDLPIVLLGTSMGAAAILRAMSTYSMDVDAIILECPFGTMYEAVANRFHLMGVPEFPLAHLLMLHGNWIGGFDAYQHNPDAYAKDVNVPVMLIYGKHDDRVTMNEINSIFNNLSGPKTLLEMPNSRHENYFNKDASLWKQKVITWLEQESNIITKPSLKPIEQ